MNDLRVIVAHNRYRSAFPSGENRVVEIEIEGLRDLGVNVEPVTPSSDDIGSMPLKERISLAASPITGASRGQLFEDVLDRFRPDIVHVHNLYPMLSPAVTDACSRRHVPVVATIHNFRLRCMNGLLYRDGAICTKCERSRTPLPGVLHGCYRDSRAQSAVMATALWHHRRRWLGVSKLIAVSQFVADRLCAWGFEDSRVTVKPNPVPDPGLPSPPGSGFLFAGRLAPEKGVRLLLDAWERSELGRLGQTLTIAGDGELLEEVMQKAAVLPGIELAGLRSAEEISALRQKCAVGVVPSLWFEAHSAVGESFAHGRPVVVTELGALESLVDKSVGWTTAPSVDGLARALVAASDMGVVAKKGLAARARFERVYEEHVVNLRLRQIYLDTLGR